jgi:hypothetical protein
MTTETTKAMSKGSKANKAQKAQEKAQREAQQAFDAWEAQFNDFDPQSFISREEFWKTQLLRFVRSELTRLYVSLPAAAAQVDLEIFADDQIQGFADFDKLTVDAQNLARELWRKFLTKIDLKEIDRQAQEQAKIEADKAKQENQPMQATQINGSSNEVQPVSAAPASTAPAAPAAPAPAPSDAQPEAPKKRRGRKPSVEGTPKEQAAAAWEKKRVADDRYHKGLRELKKKGENFVVAHQLGRFADHLQEKANGVNGWSADLTSSLLNAIALIRTAQVQAQACDRPSKSTQEIGVGSQALIKVDKREMYADFVDSADELSKPLQVVKLSEDKKMAILQAPSSRIKVKVSHLQ